MIIKYQLIRFYGIKEDKKIRETDFLSFDSYSNFLRDLIKRINLASLFSLKFRAINNLKLKEIIIISLK